MSQSERGLNLMTALAAGSCAAIALLALAVAIHPLSPPRCVKGSFAALTTSCSAR